MQHEVDGSAGDPPIRRRSNFRPPPEGFRYPFTDGVPGDSPRPDADATEPTPEWPAGAQLPPVTHAPDPQFAAPQAAEPAVVPPAAPVGAPAGPEPTDDPGATSTLDRIEWLQAELARRGLAASDDAAPDPAAPFGPRFVDAEAGPASVEQPPVPSAPAHDAPLGISEPPAPAASPVSPETPVPPVLGEPPLPEQQAPDEAHPQAPDDEPDPFEELLALVEGDDSARPTPADEASTPDPFHALLTGPTVQTVQAVDETPEREIEAEHDRENRRGLRSWFGRGRRE